MTSHTLLLPDAKTKLPNPILALNLLAQFHYLRFPSLFSITLLLILSQRIISYHYSASCVFTVFVLMPAISLMVIHLELITIGSCLNRYMAAPKVTNIPLVCTSICSFLKPYRQFFLNLIPLVIL